MRNIVFSFDDGLHDFKDYALPLFNYYDFKATINVITNYSELGEFEGYKYLSIEELVKLKEDGFELACHSDTHQKKVSIQDLLTAKKKMTKYFGNEKYGLILPFSQCIDDDKTNFIVSNFSYLADYKTKRRKNNFYYLISRLILKFRKSERFAFYYRNFSYFHTQNNSYPFFKRLPIKNNLDAKTYIHFLKHMPNNTTVFLMFHSITRQSEDCPWPDGSWDVEKLDCLLNFLDKKRKKFRVVTQKDALYE